MLCYFDSNYCWAVRRVHRHHPLHRDYQPYLLGSLKNVSWEAMLKGSRFVVTTPCRQRGPARKRNMASCLVRYVLTMKVGTAGETTKASVLRRIEELNENPQEINRVVRVFPDSMVECGFCLRQYRYKSIDQHFRTCVTYKCYQLKRYDVAVNAASSNKKKHTVWKRECDACLLFFS